jgi:hypothetical protein
MGTEAMNNRNVKNHSSRAVWVVETNTAPDSGPRAHSLAPGYQSPSNIDALGIRAVDELPIFLGSFGLIDGKLRWGQKNVSGKNWWRIPNSEAVGVWGSGTSGAPLVLVDNSTFFGTTPVVVPEPHFLKPGQALEYLTAEKGWGVALPGTPASPTTTIDDPQPTQADLDARAEFYKWLLALDRAFKLVPQTRQIFQQKVIDDWMPLRRP